MNHKLLVFILLSLLLLSCAAHFHRIDPSKIQYTNTNSIEGLNFSYRYNVLQEFNNNRYASKESRGLVKLVGVKITNTSGRDIIIRDDLQFMQNDYPVEIISSKIMRNFIQQNSTIYLLYLLLSPLQLYVQDGHEIKTFPIGLIIGPSLAFFNIAGAHSANVNMEKNINDFDILSKTVKDGDTVYGFLCIQSSSYDPLGIKMK